MLPDSRPGIKLNLYKVLKQFRITGPAMKLSYRLILYKWMIVATFPQESDMSNWKTLIYDQIATYLSSYVFFLSTLILWSSSMEPNFDLWAHIYIYTYTYARSVHLDAWWAFLYGCNSLNISTIDADFWHFYKFYMLDICCQRAAYVNGS